MAEALKIKAGFIPYSDGSGYQVDVVIEQEYNGGPFTISIETGYKVEVTHWPAIRDGIERLLLAVPLQEENNG